MSKPRQPCHVERIGVISYTHGLLRPEALDFLKGADRILHAGDVGDPTHLDVLARIALVTAIRGNIDRSDWAKIVPETETLTIGGLRIHMFHDRKALRADPATEGWDVAISGHSHIGLDCWERSLSVGLDCSCSASVGRVATKLPHTTRYAPLSGPDQAPP